jgi:uncharacterized protein (DUF2236 family)
VFDAPGALALPSLLQRRIDDLVQSWLQPDQHFDFSTPPGEPALIASDSISWRIFKNPISVFIGGVTAVLLEFAEPRVRDGVWQHSRFQTEPLMRLRRTGLAAMVTVYGPSSKAKAIIAGVVRRHGQISGLTREGEPYHANDPELLDWVQATAAFGFVEAYHTYVRRLTAHQRAALFVEGLPAARLYGATGAPASQDQLDGLFERMRPRIAASPIIFRFLDIMERLAILPMPARSLHHVLLKAAVELLPIWVRERLGLDSHWSLRRPERAFVRALALAGDRIVLPSSPAVQSCRRLGLPDAHLYHSW